MSEGRARRLASDSRSIEELVAVALRAIDSDEAWEAIGTLQCHGSQPVLDVAADLARSPEPERRRLAADVLGQLGWSDRVLLGPSVDLLLGLLADGVPAVVNAAAVGLGHRNDPRAIPHLVALAGHEEAEVRLGVVHGLSGHDDSAALAALIALSADQDEDVRDWATFGLGSQTEIDTPAIRDALLARTTDLSPVVRGEALVGLATRGDRRAIPALRRELRVDPDASLAGEAAALFGEPL